MKIGKWWISYGYCSAMQIESSVKKHYILFLQLFVILLLPLGAC